MGLVAWILTLMERNEELTVTTIQAFPVLEKEPHIPPLILFIVMTISRHISVPYRWTSMDGFLNVSETHKHFNVSDRRARGTKVIPFFFCKVPS